MTCIKNSLETIADLLIHSTERQQVFFYVEQVLPPDQINLDVKGIGPIHFPLSESDIQKLIDLSAKAAFGLREKTLVDERIRNTQEIKADQLQVTIDEAVLTPMLKHIAVGLGLSEEAVIRADLHSLLVYGPGQFFHKHQDSEKCEGMIATLVIVLPVAHIGGDLIIEHENKKHVFSSESIHPAVAQCVAFYSDCEHEVKPVKQGYRITATQNIVCDGVC